MTAIAPQLAEMDALYARALALAQSTCRESWDIRKSLYTLAGSIQQDSKLDGSLDECMYAEATRFASATARLAERVLSTPAAPFLIDEKVIIHESLRQAYRCKGAEDKETWMSFAPSSLWGKLTAGFDADKLRNRAAKTAARDLMYAFGFHRKTDVKEVRGRVELILSIKANKSWSGAGERYIEHIWQQDGIFKAWAAFEAQALPTESHGLFIAFSEELKKRSYGQTPVRSRERVTLHPELDIVYFFDCIKLYVSPSIAGALNAFVSEFAAEELNGHY